MKRADFVKRVAFGGVGLLSLGFSSFSFSSREWDRNQLIGKGNSNLVGNTYRTKLHRKTAKAYYEMHEAAEKDGISLTYVSGYRSFKHQRSIFEKRFKSLMNQGYSGLEAIHNIIEYSAIPGTSRHHWGTDLDIIDPSVPSPADPLEEMHFYKEGVYAPLKKWLDDNAQRFGFFEVYTDQPDRKGFKHEPWHFSFAEVAVPALKAYQEKIDVHNLLKEEELPVTEFLTKEKVEKYVKEHILDINTLLIP